MTTVTNTTSKKSAITADIFGQVLTLTFQNGQEIVVDATKLSEKIAKSALMHGLKQKLVDAAAIARDIETGKSATIEDKFNAVKKVADRLMRADGEWNEGRSAAGEGTGGIANILIRALMKMTGHDAAYTKAFLENKTKEERAALRKNPQVLAVIAELQAATVSNGINTSALLGELGVVSEQEQPAEEPSEQPVAVATPSATKPNTRTSKKKLVTTTE